MTILASFLARFRLSGIIVLLISATVLVGCTLDMRDQPRYDSFEESTFFADHSSARPRVADTIARGQLQLDQQLATGRVDGKLTESFPFTVTLALLQRGHERYEVFCTPCHGLLGDGQGVVTNFGMKTPPSFHTQEMRDEPAGFFFETITDGTRVMPSYASRIPIADRWAIVAYVRALQLSQNADASQAPPDALPQLDQTEILTK